MTIRVSIRAAKGTPGARRLAELAAEHGWHVGRAGEDLVVWLPSAATADDAHWLVADLGEVRVEAHRTPATWDELPDPVANDVLDGTA